jgi:hypothetical protein
LLDLIHEHNRLDFDLYEVGKKLFEENLHRNQDTITDRLNTSGSFPKAGSWKKFCYSNLGLSRFLLSKIASAIQLDLGNPQGSSRASRWKSRRFSVSNKGSVVILALAFPFCVVIDSAVCCSSKAV